MSAPVKRGYDSTRRQALAEETRRQIVDAATPLFVDQGYEATSMRQLADAAGVSLQTLYNAFGSKFGVFSRVMDVVIVGDHEAVALADRPAMRALADVDDPERLVAGIVDAALPVLERLAVIYPTLRAAAVSDAQVAEAHQRFAVEARYHDHRSRADLLAETGGLRPGVDAARAADVIWTVLSPDVFDLLRRHRGWSVEEVRAWATETLTTSLLGPPAAQGSRP